ncbi:MAG TPA: universal stress protein [Puia sp.]|nr:universal stress protein [Puia sp.]
MKKILFVCDGGNFSNGAFEFLKTINEAEPVLATGLFFAPLDFQQLVAVSYIPIAAPFVRLKEEEEMLVKKSKSEFEKQCQLNGIKYNIDDKNEEWLADLFAKQTRFADLAIISEELFCADIDSSQPNSFMQEALRIAECPVVLAPEHFKKLDRIIVAYDAKKESIHAMKQFCYTLSSLTDKPAEFVYVKDEDTEDIPDVELLKEYSRLHFGSLGVSKLHFNAHKYFSTWAESKNNSLLVTGAFSRSTISNFLKNSFAGEVIHKHSMPVFIAHHA